MAVYQGARIRALGLPSGARPVAARRSSRIPARARRRLRPVAFVFAGILVAFLLGLVYLTQTLQAGVTNYQIDSLLIERQRLQQELQSQKGSIAQWGSEPQVIQWAQQQGLNRLGGKIRVPAR
jgi:ABC-type Fe3+ transport system permease subunit